MNKRLIYAFVILGTFAIIAVGVYALSPGIKPDPGHKIDEEVSIPGGCQENQFFQWDGSTWFCSSICPAGTHVVTTDYSNQFEDNYSLATSISCSSIPPDTCDGNQLSSYSCSPGDSKTCIDVYKRQTGGLGGWVCTSRSITCKKAAMLCGE